MMDSSVLCVLIVGVGMKPEDIPLGQYTHINFAFAFIDPVTFRVTGMDSQTEQLYADVTKLKRRDRNLQVWISIGGWTHNDPGPTFHTFSQLAASESAERLLRLLDHIHGNLRLRWR